MTCIVGLASSGIVYLGADSAAISDSQHEVYVRKDSKVFRVGDFIFGCAGSFRMMNILQYFFAPEEPPEGVAPYDYMCITVSDHLRELFHTHGWAKNREGAEQGGQFLVGYKGHLFYVGSDYHVGEFECGYHALGMGLHYALGSLYTTQKMLCSPPEKLLLALRAAEEFSPGVTGPFRLINEMQKEPKIIDMVKDVWARS